MGKGDFNCHLWVTLEGIYPHFSLDKHLLSLSAPIHKSKIYLQSGIWGSGSQIIPENQSKKSNCNTGKLQAKPKSPKFIPQDPSRFTVAGATYHQDIPRISKGLGYRWQHLQLARAGGERPL